jgi:hypothetical protein
MARSLIQNRKVLSLHRPEHVGRVCDVECCIPPFECTGEGSKGSPLKLRRLRKVRGLEVPQNRLALISQYMIDVPYEDHCETPLET